MLQKSAGGKRTYRKSTIHQSEAKDKGLSRFKRNIRESGTSIKTKNTNLHIAGRTGALAAGAVTEQVEGGQEDMLAPVEGAPPQVVRETVEADDPDPDSDPGSDRTLCRLLLAERRIRPEPTLP